MGVPPGSVMRPLFFLVNLNNLVENVGCKIKLFSGDTSIFSVVYNEAIAAEELHRDRERVQLWAWQWKMKFSTEKTEEVIFSVKGVKPIHPTLAFGNDDVARKSKHQHLGMILD